MVTPARLLLTHGRDLRVEREPSVRALKLSITLQGAPFGGGGLLLPIDDVAAFKAAVAELPEGDAD